MKGLKGIKTTFFKMRPMKTSLNKKNRDQFLDVTIQYIMGWFNKGCDALVWSRIFVETQRELIQCLLFPKSTLLTAFFFLMKDEIFTLVSKSWVHSSLILNVLYIVCSPCSHAQSFSSMVSLRLNLLDQDYRARTMDKQTTTHALFNWIKFFSS